MGEFNIFLKPKGLSKAGNLHAYDEEYSTEAFDKVFNADDTSSPGCCPQNGVIAKISGEFLDLKYSGLLARNGAKDIYAVVGYGSNQNWNNVKQYPMQPIGSQTFELLLPIDKSGNVNIAFKDGADHWDNNSGRNYIVTSYTGIAH